MELMPDVASSGSGAPEVQMLFSWPTTPEPAWHSPTRPPMSPTPGTLQIPASGAVRVVRKATLLYATYAVCLAVAAGAAWATGAALATGTAAAAGAAFATGAALAER